MSILATINPDEVTEAQLATFSVRHATRAIVYDEQGKIALLSVGVGAYHKLPGGGVEAGEDITDCLRRECREEIGCDILLGESLGEVHEYRQQFLQHQISYCFTAFVQGGKGVPQFTADEIIDEFSLAWYLPNEALMILESDTPHNYMGSFIVARDMAILRALQV